MTIRIATISIILALVVPLPLLAMAWLYWGSWQAGVIAALGALLVFVGVALVAFSRVRELSWLAVALPYTVGMAYTVLPDAVPLLPADDVLMTGIMGLLSFGLALRKNPATPKWPIIPLLGAAAYPLLGALVPLPIDEFVVQFLLGTLALKGVREHWAPHRVPTGARKALGRSTDG